MPDQGATQKGLPNELAQLRERVKHLEGALYELQQRQKAAQESTLSISDILDDISDGFYSLDRNLTVTYFNRSAEQLLGRKSQDVVGRILFEAFPETKGSIFEEKYIQALRERQPLAFETYFDESPYENWYEVRVYANPNGISVFFRITTQRKRSEEALKESEEKYRLLVENANDAIFIVQDEMVKFANAKAVQITGYSLEELTRHPIFELIHPEDREMVLDRHRRRIKGETPPSTYSFRMTTRAGEILWVQLNVVLISWESRPATLNLMRDITLEKTLEAQLLQAQKMEAIGTLAGGIAHDFNNILAAIIGYTELTLSEIPTKNPVRHNLEQVLKAGQRAKNLVQQILSFSRHSEHELKPVHLVSILKEGLKMIRASLPTTIEIKREIDPKAGNVLADPTQIHQVLMNLCANAAQAMSETGGVLTVSLQGIELGEDETACFASLTPGKYNLLTVSDTGGGMDEKTLARIFDPFFSTKSRDQGTGLGLAVVHGIINQHKGEITVNSRPNSGSIFKIYLPVIEEETKAEIEIENFLPLGRENILFVDDEESLVEIGQGILERLGYQVTAKTSAIDALELFKAKPDKFNLVITDQTMPKMSGSELAAELKKIRPDLPIILCTGYSDQVTPERLEAAGIQELIMKPIPVRDLAGIVRRLLDRPSKNLVGQDEFHL